MNNYDVRVLLDMAGDCCANEEWNRYIQRKNDKHQSNAAYTQALTSWEFFNRACQLVGADPAAVLAVHKSIRRNCQYKTNWEHIPQFSRSWSFAGMEYSEPGSEASFRRAVSANRLGD